MSYPRLGALAALDALGVFEFPAWNQATGHLGYAVSPGSPGDPQAATSFKVAGDVTGANFYEAYGGGLLPTFGAWVAAAEAYMVGRRWEDITTYSAVWVPPSAESWLPGAMPPYPVPPPPPPPAPIESELPSMQCEAPSSPVLQPDERWYLSDALACAWQLIRDGQPTPDIYQGPSHIYVPQSAPAPRIPLPAPAPVTGVTWPPRPAAAIPEGEEVETATTGGGDGWAGGVSSWVAANPYLAAGGALAGLWFLFRKRR